MNIKELKQKALAGDLNALEELRKLGVISGNKTKYTMAPVSSAQSRLWFIDKMDHSPAYNLSAGVLLEGKLNFDALEKAFQEIVKRHEILRTYFVETDGIPYQKILENLDFKIKQTSINSIENSDFNISEIIKNEVNYCFDLSKAPLFFCNLVRIEQDKHLMIFNMHHIITDGWSIGVLMSELTILYNSFNKGENNSDNKLLSPLKIQYKDYVLRNSRMLKENSATKLKNYWVNQFSGDLLFTELPSDKPRPLFKTFNGSEQTFIVEQTLSDKINDFVKKENVSKFMFLMSVANILIYRYSGKRDITIGSPISGREQKDLEDQIGFYVNTIMIRNTIDETNSFRSFLANVRKNCIDAYDHQAYPFELLVEDLNLERDTSHDALSEILLTLEDLSSDELPFDGIKAKFIKPEVTLSKMHLHLNFTETEEKIGFSITYNPDVYTDSKIKRFGNHLLQLAYNLLDKPEEKINRIEFITQEEKARILHVFNDTTTYYQKEKTIAGIFEQMVENYPDKPSLVYQGSPITYKQLNEKANIFGHQLIEKYSLQLDEPVVLLMDRSHDLIISMLAIIKAGGAYLPIDTQTPSERINFILDDVKARIVITDQVIQDGSLRAQHILPLNSIPKVGNQSNINCNKNSSNLAYIIYTSGSTGMPKGCMIEEKSVMRLVINTNYCKFDNNVRMLSTSSISFDTSTIDIWGTLLNGGTLYFENTEDYLDPEKFTGYISKYNLNFIVIPTGLFVRLAEADQQNKLGLFKGLSDIFVGGDKLPSKISNIFISLYPEIRLVNVYGPTENTTLSTYFVVNKEFQEEIPIGKPISNSTVYVFDNNEILCPIGVQGEICAGGDGLARGYVNRPELNKKSFFENPVIKGDRLYHTGDLGQWDEEGNLRIIGRNDDQLKIRGYRVETGEIENTASLFPNITKTKILVINKDDQKLLALYYTSDKSIIHSELKKYLEKSLPEYMIPRYFVAMDEFPLNINGKLDIHQFPKPEVKQEQNEESQLPSTLTEKILAGIFEEILNIKKVLINDDFFSLGGNSLKAIRVISAIQKELSVKLNLKEFFSSPDICSLQEIIRDKKIELLGSIPIIEEADLYELSHAQKRLWVLDKIEKSKATYNIPLAINIYDEVDVQELQSALDDMVSKHESLRTIFVEVNGTPFQKIIEDKPIIKKLDLTDEKDPEAAAYSFIVTESHRPFTLSEFPLMRMAVIKTGNERYILFLNIHHIICDGWSVNIMMEYLFDRYKKHIVEPTIQYKDYASWMNKSLSDLGSSKDRDYWLEKLTGELLPLEVPTDFHRPTVKTYQGDSIYFTFTKELKSRLDKFNIEKRCSMFMTLTAAFKILLYRYTGKEDIIIGTPAAGRNHPDLEKQIGYFVNTLALRDQIDPKRTFAEFLENVKKTAIESYSHQMYPFDKLVEELRLSRDTDRSPLFDFMIVMQNIEDTYQDKFKRIEPYKIPMNISKFDITLIFNEINSDLELLIEYNTQLYKKERIEQLFSHLQVLLNEIADNPSQSIDAINILDTVEKGKLLHEFNDTSVTYPEDKNIIQLFEETVERYSSNVAVLYKDKALTYSELNEKSNNIANAILKRKKIKTAEPVCVLLNPSEKTIITLLAILKAGACYVPIDSEYPDERIKNILTDSHSGLIITQTDNQERLSILLEDNNIKCDIINIDDISEENDQHLKIVETNPDATAYVIFTSGSTGKPKGCQISHRNLIRLFVNDNCQYDFKHTDVWIMAHSYCFDFSVWEMYGALLFGGKLVVPDRNEVRDISAFVRLVLKHKVTVLNQTPGAFYKFAETIVNSSYRNPLNLRYVIFGGDKLNPSKLVKWINLYPTEKVKLINMYGITETTIHVTYHNLTDEEILTNNGSSNIGVPLPETRVYVLDKIQQLCPIGVYGEIYVAGSGLSKGYLNSPELTAERFIQNPYIENDILYKSGDIGRFTYNGTLEYLDRCDNQVQIRGFRVETAEIEMKLRKYSSITDAVVIAVEKDGVKELVAYIVADKGLKINELKSFLSTTLPVYMLPSYFIGVDKIPLTTNGKLDKKQLPPPVQNIDTGAIFEKPVNEIESGLLELWQEVLSIKNISIHDNFFDIGGNSILLVNLYGKINLLYPEVFELTDLFSKSRIAEQASYISQKLFSDTKAEHRTLEGHENGHDIAIIGMAIKIGSCTTPDDFWKEISNGKDFISSMPSARVPDILELALNYNLDYENFEYRKYCYLPEVDKFDYSFFKLSPSEASLIEPGQRLFMETGYQAIEDAGYGGDRLWGSKTGIYIGASDNTGEYSKYIEYGENVDPNLLLTAQTPSILASRLSYYLNLKGPALLVDTACSSSLVALHLACQSIREGKIDSALVGASKLHLLPIDTGSRIEIDSSDGLTRSFDDSSNGTGGGEGVIAIFIKPLEKALKDNDNIYAVIKGSEINQDGNSIGITAPNAEAQADVIDKAWQDSRIDPTTISFIETHGTATKLGDPIEIDGITKAFRRYTTEKSFCALGAVKANIGHLDTASGLAGLFKAVLCLKHKKLTPLSHFKTPNRNINFDDSPVYINKELKDWESTKSPLRCGVSSFGLSGTNCHVILEEPPLKTIKETKTYSNLIFTLSSRSKAGLLEYVEKLRNHIDQNPDINPENLCYTLAVGRGHYNYRLAIIFNTLDELKELLCKPIDTEEVCFNLTNAVDLNKKEIAEAYIKGSQIKWSELYSDSTPEFISLPTYPFEKKRCWVKLKSSKATKTVATSSFLTECIVDTPTVSVYRKTFSQTDWLLNEHRVMGQPTLVGASYLQMAYEVGISQLGSSRLNFSDFYLLKPLTLGENDNIKVLVSVNKNDSQSLYVEINSKTEDSQWQSYTRFKVSKGKVITANRLEIDEIKSRTIGSRDVSITNEQKKEEIVEVSRKWDCLKKIYWTENEYLAELNVPDKDENLAETFYFYPPLLDAALSFAIDEPGFLPYSFGTVEMFKKSTNKIVSYARLTESTSETRVFDITISDMTGDIIAVFNDFMLKRIVVPKQGNLLHTLVWKPWALDKSEKTSDSKVVVLYQSDCNNNLINKLKSLPGVSTFELTDDNLFEKVNKNLSGKVIFLLPQENLLKTLYLAFNFAKWITINNPSKLELLFVAENVSDISGDEIKLNSLNYAVAGLGQVIQQENPTVACRFLDIEENTSTQEIMDELNHGFAETYYYRAIRGNKRLIREFKSISIDDLPSGKIEFLQNNVYVITGGTGGIGLELAHFLSRQAKIKIVLINRSAFPSRSDWDKIKDESLLRKIEKIREIEKEVGELYFYQSDISDYESLCSIFSTIKKDHGRVAGIMHAAGLPGDGFIFGKDISTFKTVINPKIQGTINLAKLMQEDRPDFFLMTSALTAILPTSGQSDYTAANSFMDAFSSELNRIGINAVSINLTSWKETGMAFNYGVVDDGIFKSISTKDGIESIGRILQKKISSIILGELDMSYLVTTDGLPFYSEKLIKVNKKEFLPETEKIDQVVLKGREDGAYTKFEIAISQVWGDVLGYSEINLNDNYYDLGGDSIHAIKIDGLLEKSLGIKVTISDLFNHLTIADLAAFLETKSENSKVSDSVSDTVSDTQEIVLVEKSSHYVASSAQRRLYILDQLINDKLGYHLPEVWNIKGKLDIDNMVLAFNKTIERHEMLRTSFTIVDDEPVQIIHESVDFYLPFNEMGEDQAREYIRGFVKPFDLSKAPLFSAEIIKIAEDNHLVLFDAHHIIMDALSMEIFKKDLFGFYEGKNPQPLTLQYKDYSNWQNSYLKKQEADIQKKWWVDKFKGELPLINLPLDFPRTSNQSSQAGIFSLCLDEKLTSAIKKLSSENGISTFMILYAVYSIVLHKYTQQNDVIIGVTTTGRDNEALSGLLGMFVNSIPLRAYPTGEKKVADFLEEVKTIVLNGFANQNFPFDELVDSLNLKRDLQRSPLFDVVFSYMNFELTDIKNSELQVSDFIAETTISSEYDIMLYGLEAFDKIYITIKYKKSLFKKESIERFALHFIKTTEILTTEKPERISDIKILLPEEISLLNSFNQQNTSILRSIDVIDLLSDSFDRNREKTAVIYKDNKMSYQELNIKANKLANYLRDKHSIQPNDLVGIMVNRTESMVVAMLGVLKSGAAYVGIDIAYPKQRKDYILNNSKSKLVLTNLPDTEYENIDDIVKTYKNSEEPSKINAIDDLSHVIYTSGSTGKPKGVALTRKNLSVFLRWCDIEFKYSDYEMVYASTSICFDLSIVDIFYSLMAGKTIRVLKSAMEIPEYVSKDHKIQINTVPSLMLTIMDDLSQGGFDNIKVINLGGEQVPQSLIENIDCDRIEFRNVYGPSEDTTYSTSYRFSNKSTKVLIGKPISNTQIYLTDQSMNLVPIGHSGEICIAGDGLARGYLNNEDLTNQKFISNIFNGGKLYKTGDLGRWTETGDLEFIGRIDNQVKIRGFRVELGEIESNLMQYPSIENAVVVAYSKDESKEIAAYVVTKSEISIKDLREYLRNQLPSFMIPSHFVIMGSLPLNPNGKVDLMALPVPKPESDIDELLVSEELNQTEKELSDIWKRVLNIDTLSKYDSFFDMGGHSLKALKLISQINREFKSHFVLSDIFEYPSVEKFAGIATNRKFVSMAKLSPLEKAENYETSHAQRRLWTIDRMRDGAIAYNIPIVYHITSELDIDALQESFKAIIYKHESLRTYFIEIEGEPRQFILDDFEFNIQVLDVNASIDFISETKGMIHQLIACPFNLEEAPLIKVNLLRNIEKPEFVLVVNVHHIILDEWSIEIMTDDLLLFYDHFSGAKSIIDKSIFEPAEIQYKEFAHWQNREIDKSRNTHKEYWMDLFSTKMPCLDLPFDFQRPKNKTFEGKTEAFVLSDSVTEKLMKIVSESKTTMFITNLALFNVLFSKYSGQSDIVIGTPIANRENREIQDQIGFFLNTLALRNKLDKDESFESFLRKVKRNTLDAFDHQIYPFDLLVDELHFSRDLSRSPLFDVMLISQTQATKEETKVRSLKMNTLEFEYNISKFDLSISYCEENGQLKYFFEYNTALFKGERIRKMFGHFSNIIEAIYEDIDISISNLSIASKEETRHLFDLSEGVCRPLINSSIVSMIENSISKNEDQIAVVFKNKKLTFKELNCRANQLSNLLISEGVKAGELVCVMLDRSEWSVISMLAILKAGCVYVPVDPNYPQNRIDYIIKDSGSNFMITENCFTEKISFEKDKVYVVEDIVKRLSILNDENVNLTIDLVSPSYIIYTSGSTGLPKGVLCTHKCLLNLIEWQLEFFDTKIKTLQYAPHSFDASLQEMLYALSTGGTLYMIENDARYKMSLLAEMIKKESIELITMTYSALSLFLGEVENIEQLQSLKYIITSGEQPYINDNITKLLNTYPGIKLHNHYGPSETHVVTYFYIDHILENQPVKIPTGRPINNTQIYLLDKNMQLVPVGLRGDLYIGGMNVALGYLNKKELTEERFLDNPFGEGKLYRSGDVARWDFDGQLDFLGRDDGQVKVRGYRIELGEIETCILKFPNIKEVAVKLTGEGESVEIAAYFTSCSEINILSLKEYLSTQVPAYMIPAYFIKLELFPYTSSGKVDALSLPAPRDSDNTFLSEYVGPEGTTETVIVGVWQEILQRNKISVLDNFFEIGGNSIKAIQVMSKVQKNLGKKTYLNLIFKQSTVRQMATIIDDTDVKLKNMEVDYLLLNNAKGQNLFFMPPGIGYSFAYMEYAKYFDEYAAYGLNFVESSNPEKSMADIVSELQPNGPIYLFGHSAGGNMAFDVALELQDRGRQIGGILMLDCYRQLNVIDWSEEEYLNDAILYIEQNHAEFLDEEIKESAFNKIISYRKYLNARSEIKPLNCPIIQIEATDVITIFGDSISRIAWEDLTTFYKVFEGFGGHMDMLKQPNLSQNAKLTNVILGKLIQGIL